MTDLFPETIQEKIDVEKVIAFRGETFYLNVKSIGKIALEYPFIAAVGIEDILKKADLRIAYEKANGTKMKRGAEYVRLRVFLNAYNDAFKRKALGLPEDYEMADERWQL